MQINQRQLRLECLDYGMKRIAQALDIKPNTITVKLKDPTNRLYSISSSKSVSYWKNQSKPLSKRRFNIMKDFPM